MGGNMQKKFIQFVSSSACLIASSMIVSGQAQAASWNGYNNPNNFSSSWQPIQYTYSLQSLPASGRVANEDTPWSDSYWPKQRGAMGYRWFKFQNENMDQDVSAAQRRELFFSDTSPSKKDLLNMTADQQMEIIAKLSPLEKYSIYTKDFKYSLVKQFHNSRMGNNPDRAYWEGYCHAWTAAALHHREPKPVIKEIEVNGKTIKIPFGSADIKALLTANYSLQFVDNQNLAIGGVCQKRFLYPTTKMKKGVEVMASYADTDGALDTDLEKLVAKFKVDARRVQASSKDLDSEWANALNMNNLEANARKNAEDPACKGVNAGTFHIVMANQLGLMKEGFGFDKTRDVEIWNQPAFKYESTISDQPVALPANAAPSAVKAVAVSTRIYYADDTDYGWAFWNPTLTNLFSDDQAFMGEYQQYQRMLMNQGDVTEMPTYPAHILDYSNYKYILELDAQGNIVGGEWLTLDRPDFLWMMKAKGYVSELKALPELYEPIQFPANAQVKI